MECSGSAQNNDRSRSGTDRPKTYGSYRSGFGSTTLGKSIVFDVGKEKFFSTDQLKAPIIFNGTSKWRKLN
jgi:hypothetical protein